MSSYRPLYFYGGTDGGASGEETIGKSSTSRSHRKAVQPKETTTSTVESMFWNNIKEGLSLFSSTPQDIHTGSHGEEPMGADDIFGDNPLAEPEPQSSSLLKTHSESRRGRDQDRATTYKSSRKGQRKESSSRHSKSKRDASRKKKKSRASDEQMLVTSSERNSYDYDSYTSHSDFCWLPDQSSSYSSVSHKKSPSRSRLSSSRPRSSRYRSRSRSVSRTRSGSRHRASRYVSRSRSRSYSPRIRSGRRRSRQSSWDSRSGDSYHYPSPHQSPRPRSRSRRSRSGRAGQSSREGRHSHSRSPSRRTRDSRSRSPDRSRSQSRSRSPDRNYVSPPINPKDAMQEEVLPNYYDPEAFVLGGRPNSHSSHDGKSSRQSNVSLLERLENWSGQGQTSNTPMPNAYDEHQMPRFGEDYSSGADRVPFRQETLKDVLQRLEEPKRQHSTSNRPEMDPVTTRIHYLQEELATYGVPSGHPAARVNPTSPLETERTQSKRITEEFDPVSARIKYLQEQLASYSKPDQQPITHGPEITTDQFQSAPHHVADSRYARVERIHGSDSLPPASMTPTPQQPILNDFRLESSHDSVLPQPQIFGNQEIQGQPARASVHASFLDPLRQLIHPSDLVTTVHRHKPSPGTKNELEKHVITIKKDKLKLWCDMTAMIRRYMNQLKSQKCRIIADMRKNNEHKDLRVRDTRRAYSPFIKALMELEIHCIEKIQQASRSDLENWVIIHGEELEDFRTVAPMRKAEWLCQLIKLKQRREETYPRIKTGPKKHMVLCPDEWEGIQPHINPRYLNSFIDLIQAQNDEWESMKPPHPAHIWKEFQSYLQSAKETKSSETNDKPKKTRRTFPDKVSRLLTDEGHTPKRGNDDISNTSAEAETEIKKSRLETLIETVSGSFRHEILRFWEGHVHGSMPKSVEMVEVITRLEQLRLQSPTLATNPLGTPGVNAVGSYLDQEMADDMRHFWHETPSNEGSTSAQGKRKKYHSPTYLQNKRRWARQKKRRIKAATPTQLVSSVKFLDRCHL